MTEKLLLELIVILLGCLLGLIGFLFKSHSELHKSLEDKLEEVKEQRVECGSAFATKDSVIRAHGRLDEQQAELGELSTRVARLEACDRRQP